MELIARSGQEVGLRQGAASWHADEKLDVMGQLSRIWKHKVIIVFMTVILMIPATAFILSLKPKYRAEAQVMVDDRRTQLLGVADALSAHSWGESAVLSEVQVLSSRDLAKAVIRRLHLNDDPSFAPPHGPSLRERLKEYLRELPYVRDVPFLSNLLAPAEARSNLGDSIATDQFLANLSVLPTGRSNVLRIQYESSSPTTAALIANTIAEIYLADQIKRKVDAARSVTHWIEDHLNELRIKTEQARLAKETYMQQIGMYLNDRNSTLVTQQVSDLAKQLLTAQAQLNVAEARLEAAKAAKASGKAPAASDASMSPQLGAQRQALAAQQEKIASLEATYGSSHPLVIQAKAELQGIRANIGTESIRFMQGLEADVAREKANFARLQEAVNVMKTEVVRTNQAGAKLASLDHDVVANDAIYQMFLDRVKQTQFQQSTQESDSLLISRADPPPQAYFPKTGMLLVLAALTAILLSIAAALVIDHRRKTFLAVDQMRFELGAEVLGLVPMVKRLGSVPDARRLGNRTVVGVPFAESVRNLQVRLMISSLSTGELPRSILFASAAPGEGKTSTVVAFAMAAATRRRVVVVDCDTRRPQIHTAFGVKRGPGLTDYLEGTPLDDVIQSADGYSLDVIASGSLVAHPADLLGTGAMRSLLSALEERYDCIVIDTPPVLAVPDAMVIVPFIDRTVLLVQWGKTPQESAERALRMMSEAGAKVTGTVLSKVTDKLARAEHYVEYYSEVHA